MLKLLRGVHEFQTGAFPERRTLFESLAGKQEPVALFITCSDSRVNPSLITQTEPGDLFIIRNAGNIVPAFTGAESANGGEEATIEYAVSALGIRDIIVCGHSDCGAMKGLLNRGSVEAMPSVKRWLGHAEATRRIVTEKHGRLEGASLLSATICENVMVQIGHLRTHPAVAARLAQGELRIHGWVYDIEKGTVQSYQPEERRFANLALPGAASPDGVSTGRAIS